jgi:peptide/nickel transport system permease protein
VSAADPVIEPGVEVSVARGGYRRRLSKAGLVAAVVLAILAILALLGGVIAPKDPTLVDLRGSLAGPSWEHLLGTDGQGRDLLSRLIAGARTGLLGPLLVVAICTPLGTATALAVSWRRGWLDTTASRGFDLLLGFPGLLLAILAAAIFGKGIVAAAVAIAISYTPYVYRLVRGGAYRETAQPYVAALRIQGFGTLRILGRHVLPNLGRLLLAQSTVLFAYATADLAAVSFLGLGVQPPTADWGAMTAAGLEDLVNGNVAESLLASLMITITIVSANVLGNSLEGEGKVIVG